MPTDQDIERRAWADNAARVAADPAAATVIDLQRAAGFLSHRLVWLRHRADRAGRILDRELAAGILHEIAWYDRLIRERRA